MVFGEGLDPFQGVDPRGGGLQGGGVDVGGVEQGPVEQALLAEQDGEGMQLLALAAAGDPHLQRRIGAQVRRHLLAHRPVVAGIAEHLADLHGQEVQKARDHGGVVQHRVLQGREALEPQLLARLLQPPLDRRLRIMAEIVVVAPVERFQQQLDLDVLDAFAHPHAL